MTSTQEQLVKYDGYSSEQTSSPLRDRAEILQKKHYPPLEHENIVHAPYKTAKDREREFQKKLSELSLEAAICAKAWMSGRPIQELQASGQNFTAEINAVRQKEEKQGRSSSPSLSTGNTVWSLFERTRRRLATFLFSLQHAVQAVRDEDSEEDSDP